MSGYEDFAAGAAETPESQRAVWEQQQIEANAARDIRADQSKDQGNTDTPDPFVGASGLDRGFALPGGDFEAATRGPQPWEEIPDRFGEAEDE
jgi:hypothetical protein